MSARRSPLFTWLPRGAAGGAAIYAAVLAAGHFLYRGMLYPAAGRPDAPRPDDARVLACTASDGVPVHALEFDAGRADARTVVYFHGNGEVVGDDVPIARQLVRRGFHVVLVEYRGYGMSAPGSPSEPGLYADAEAVLSTLAARGVDRTRIVLWGMSLGSGVAAEMARRGRGDTLVLVAAYTSIVDVAAHYFPIFPVRLMIRERFDTLSKAESIHARTIVFHGTRDGVVPFTMGRKVAAAIDGAVFVPVEGGGHADLFWGDGARRYDTARSFILGDG